MTYTNDAAITWVHMQKYAKAMAAVDAYKAFVREMRAAGISRIRNGATQIGFLVD